MLKPQIESAARTVSQMAFAAAPAISPNASKGKGSGAEIEGKGNTEMKKSHHFGGKEYE